TQPTACTDRLMRLWDVPSRRIRAAVSGSGAAVRFIAFSPDGETLASSGYEPVVRLWNVETGKALGKVRVGMSVNCVLFSPDGKSLAVSEAYEPRPRPAVIKLFDVETKREQRTLAGHAGQVINLAFSPDGRLLVS